MAKVLMKLLYIFSRTTGQESQHTKVLDLSFLVLAITLLLAVGGLLYFALLTVT